MACVVAGVAAPFNEAFQDEACIAEGFVEKPLRPFRDPRNDGVPSPRPGEGIALLAGGRVSRPGALRRVLPGDLAAPGWGAMRPGPSAPAVPAVCPPSCHPAGFCRRPTHGPLAANRRKRTEAFRPAWGLLFLRETFDASTARGVHDVYEFHIDDSVISVIVDDGEMQVIEGPSSRPVDVAVHVDATTFLDVGMGRLRGRDAIRQGKLRLVGSEAALRRYASIIRPLTLARPGGARLDRHGGSIPNRSRGKRSEGATARR
jgi:SCP-2 sterol transfer family